MGISRDYYDGVMASMPTSTPNPGVVPQAAPPPPMPDAPPATGGAAMGSQPVSAPLQSTMPDASTLRQGAAAAVAGMPGIGPALAPVVGGMPTIASALPDPHLPDPKLANGFGASINAQMPKGGAAAHGVAPTGPGPGGPFGPPLPTPPMFRTVGGSGGGEANLWTKHQYHLAEQANDLQDSALIHHAKAQEAQLVNQELTAMARQDEAKKEMDAAQAAKVQQEKERAAITQQIDQTTNEMAASKAPDMDLPKGAGAMLLVALGGLFSKPGEENPAMKAFQNTIDVHVAQAKTKYEHMRDKQAQLNTAYGRAVQQAGLSGADDMLKAAMQKKAMADLDAAAARNGLAATDPNLQAARDELSANYDEKLMHSVTLKQASAGERQIRMPEIGMYVPEKEVMKTRLGMLAEEQKAQLHAAAKGPADHSKDLEKAMIPENEAMQAEYDAIRARNGGALPGTSIPGRLLGALAEPDDNGKRGIIGTGANALRGKDARAVDRLDRLVAAQQAHARGIRGKEGMHEFLPLTGHGASEADRREAEAERARVAIAKRKNILAGKGGGGSSKDDSDEEDK